MITLLILTVVILALLGTFSAASFSAAPWLPTKKADRTSLFLLLDPKPGERIIDLGAGDGSLLFALANKYPNLHLIGYEISLIPYCASLIRKAIGGEKYKNVKLLYRNLFRADLSQTDAVIAFLLPKSYNKLTKLFSTMKPNARILVEAWPLSDVEPEATDKQPGALSWRRYRANQFQNLPTHEA